MPYELTRIPFKKPAVSQNDLALDDIISNTLNQNKI